jgi:hypothetical protein
MAGPSRRMGLGHEEIYDELWKEDECSIDSESEFSDDSDCYSDNMVVRVLSGSEQSDSSDDEAVNDDCGMQHGTWTKVGAERPQFPFSGKTGQNVDLKDPNSPLEYFELFITPELAESKAKQRNKPVCSTIFRKYAELENKI